MLKRSKRYAAAGLALLIVGTVVAVFSFSGAPPVKTAATSGDEPKPPQIDELRGYQNWTKVNPQPVKIASVLVSVLCRAPTPVNQSHDAERSPHAGKLITVYVNDTGRAAMMTEAKPKFPVGSVIVKEKLAPEQQDRPELLTVMIKREQGFNAASGDWEYMAASGDGTKTEARGRLDNCQMCHVSMKETDFVYRSYLPDEARSQLR